MTKTSLAASRRGLTILLALFLGAACGCQRHERIQLNRPLVSPWPETMLWAVAPLNNESGTSVPDGLAIADILAGEVQQIVGIDALPVQRVLDGMRAMDIGRLESPTQALALARLLGADAVLVGTITTYDPYNPPRLGLILQLFTVEGREPIDITALRSAATDHAARIEDFEQRIPTAAGIFDAGDNAVRLEVESFAKGRTSPDSALYWRRYLVVMDLYTQYVGQRLLRQLLDDERSRLRGEWVGATSGPSS